MVSADLSCLSQQVSRCGLESTCIRVHFILNVRQMGVGKIVELPPMMMRFSEHGARWYDVRRWWCTVVVSQLYQTQHLAMLAWDPEIRVSILNARAEVRMGNRSMMGVMMRNGLRKAVSQKAARVSDGYAAATHGNE
jgi:hypothetical protein